MRLVLILLKKAADPAETTLLVAAQFATIVIVIGVIAYLAVRMINAPGAAGVGSGTSGDERSSSDPYGSFYVVALGITAVVLGFLVVLLFANRFGDLTSALGFLTALFGAITGLVGTYFGVKTSSDAREGAQSLARAAGTAGGTTPPEVTSTSPVDRADDVPPGINPIVATFSKVMDSATITPDTFKLFDPTVLAQVNGGVVYDTSTRTATFTPASPLENGKTYAATITAGVKDQAGNPLAQDYTWHFTIISADQ